jgi:hypothetical protein
LISDSSQGLLVLRLARYLTEVLDSQEGLGRPVFETDQALHLAHWPRHRLSLLLLVAHTVVPHILEQLLPVLPLDNFPEAASASGAFQSPRLDVLVQQLIPDRRFRNSKFIFCFLSFAERSSPLFIFKLI